MDHINIFNYQPYGFLWIDQTGYPFNTPRGFKRSTLVDKPA